MEKTVICFEVVPDKVDYVFPWRNFVKNITELQTPDKPPCVECKYWEPQHKFLGNSAGFLFKKTILCHAPEMKSDFSCFKERCSDQ